MSVPRTLITLLGMITMVSAVLADLVIPELAAQHASTPPGRLTPSSATPSTW